MSSKQQVARRAAADEQQLSQPQVEAREQYASAEAKVRPVRSHRQPALNATLY